MKRRGELVERTFAHVCETGGGRRTFLRVKQNVQKRHLLLAMAFDLGVIKRKLFKMGTPRSLQGLRGGLVHTIMLWWQLAIRGSYYLMPDRVEYALLRKTGIVQRAPSLVVND